MDVSIAGLYAWLDLEKEPIAMTKRDCATQLPKTVRGRARELIEVLADARVDVMESARSNVLGPLSAEAITYFDMARKGFR